MNLEELKPNIPNLPVDSNRYIVIGIIIIVCMVVVYFLFFSGTTKTIQKPVEPSPPVPKPVETPIKEDTKKLAEEIKNDFVEEKSDVEN